MRLNFFRNRPILSSRLKLILLHLFVTFFIAVGCNVNHEAYDMKKMAGQKYRNVDISVLGSCLNSVEQTLPGFSKSLCLELSYIDQKVASQEFVTVLFMNGQDISGYGAFQQAELARWKRALPHRDKLLFKCFTNETDTKGCKNLSSDAPRASVQKLMTEELGGDLAKQSVIIVVRDGEGFKARQDVARVVPRSKGALSFISSVDHPFMFKL